MKRPIIIAAAAVIAIGLLSTQSGWLTPAPSAPPAALPASSTSEAGRELVSARLAVVDAITGQVLIDGGAVLELLSTIPAGGLERSDYDRDAFGQRWADVDRNGCDTRNDTLRRDLSDVVLKPGTPGCVVLSGQLLDPFTGDTVAFQRGENTSSLVQIDHLWPLALAWDHGAAEWALEQRTAFANDPINLQATAGDVNLSKGDRGPGSWMPPAESAWCEYAARFTLVAARYELTVADVDRDALVTTLGRCSNGT